MVAAAEQTGSLDAALQHAQRLLAQDPALALRQTEEILAAVADYPPALLLQVEALRALGRHEQALAAIQSLAAAQPRWAAAHYLLGQLLARDGQGEAALQALRQAAALKPDLPGVWRSLGDHLAAVGDTAAAEAAHAQHARHSIRDPALLAAAAALHAGDLPQAEQRLRAHLKQAPTDTAAIRMLAEVAARLGRLQDAERLLSRCLQLAPGFREARQNLAFVLHRGNQPERALAELDVLAQADPRNPNVRNLRAVVLCRIGDYPPALELYSGLLREYPRQPKLWLSYGHALKTAGQQAEAIAAYQRCTALAPEFGEAWWSLANLKTFRFDAAATETMRAQLQRDGLDEEHRLHLDFALGKSLEDQGDYAASMRHYLSGNALRKRRVPYRADDTHARVQRSIASFDRAFFEQRAGFGCEAPDPIFVVGLPRSGSTLVEQILSSHSAIEGTQELPEIISMARELRERGDAADPMPYYSELARLDAAQARALGERYLAHTRIHRKDGKPLFIDKMPNNFAHIALIQLCLPQAKIVDVRRHPLACCFSGFKQHFARGQNFSYDLADIGRYYRDYVELMAHYDRVLPGRVHRVIYEDLVDNTEHEVRRLLDYCGVGFEPACLRFFENARPVRTASSEQVRRPINRDGLEQWRHFEPWLDPLRQALGPLAEADSFRAPSNVVADGA